MLKHLIASLFLRVQGWKFDGEVPTGNRYVLIAAPHTSNWDLPFLLAFAWYCRLSIHWMGKREIFMGPTGPVFRWLGGIPVDRGRRSDLVKQMAEAFAERDALILVIPPEGTRSAAPHWKSGFYRIAKEADVPLLPSFLDYAKKQGGFAHAFKTTGNITADMDTLRAIYKGRQGKYPDDFGPVRLAEESDTTPPTRESLLHKTGKR